MEPPGQTCATLRVVLASTVEAASDAASTPNRVALARWRDCFFIVVILISSQREYVFVIVLEMVFETVLVTAFMVA
jgi:hypothetical protein